MILVSIAAYRDPQLVETVQDCLAKAARPEDLRFGICWQHGPEEPRLPFADDPRFKIVDVDYRESRGVGWARAQCMNLYDGEGWYLQLDAHHRFVKDWDTKLLAAAWRSGSNKPIITAYAPHFRADDQHEPTLPEAWQMNFFDFLHGCIPVFRGEAIPGWQQRTTPVRARFVSGHLLFAPGSFVRDVPYDPTLFYCGEEITLAIRAFTHGYDLFHPVEPILWHEYATQPIDPYHNRSNEGPLPADLPTRGYTWGDHLKSKGLAENWYDRELASVGKVCRFLQQPFIGRFGCGDTRTFQEYEAYAGINFRNRCTTDHTRQYLEPPNPPMPDDWAHRISRYEFVINIDKAQASAGDACVWWIDFWNAARQQVYRTYFERDAIAAFLTGAGRTATVRVSFASETEPVLWRALPYSKSCGWLEPFEGTSRRAWAFVRRISPWELMNGRSASMRSLMPATTSNLLRAATVNPMIA